MYQIFASTQLTYLFATTPPQLSTPQPQIFLTDQQNNGTIMNTTKNTTNTPTPSFSIVMTSECKIFDFINYTVLGGCFCGCGILGNLIAFLVLNKNLTNQTSTSKSYTTWFLLRALTLADAFLSLTTIPLYVLQPITVCC